MAQRITIGSDELSAAVESLCREYVDDVEDKVSNAVEVGADVCMSQIKASAPRRKGEYASRWRKKVGSSYGAKTVTVYQSKKPGLPHLLEKGHGGPYPASAIPHIAPAAEAGKKAMLESLK